MQKSEKYIVLPIIFIILFGIAYFVYYQWRLMEENAYLSCISSIAGVIQKLDAAKELAGNNRNWKILSGGEVDLLLSQVHGYDCSVDNQTLDLWNNKLNIALRKPENVVEILVWSNGRDEISGTEDDLVIPYSEKVPQ